MRFWPRTNEVKAPIPWFVEVRGIAGATANARLYVGPLDSWSTARRLVERFNRGGLWAATRDTKPVVCPPHVIPLEHPILDGALT